MVRDQSQDRLGLSTCLVGSWTAACWCCLPWLPQPSSLLVSPAATSGGHLFTKSSGFHKGLLWIYLHRQLFFKAVGYRLMGWVLYNSGPDLMFKIKFLLFFNSYTQSFCIPVWPNTKLWNIDLYFLNTYCL